jgi:hypothetical protein
MAERIVHHETPMEYFKSLVDEAVARRRLVSSEDATFYVVSLLTGFVRPEPAAATALQQPLAIRLARALQTGGAEQRQGLRQVGDVSLFISGFFGDSLARRPVGVDYYVALGGYAYGSLGRRESEARAAVFAELAEKFVAYVDVLSEVSERTSLPSSCDLLRLYERWLQTPTRRNGERLVDRGILPTSSPGPRRVQ